MNNTEKILLKEKLLQKAVEILQERIEASSLAMSEAQAAANDEEKKSVGDKHETARAMALIDRDIHARQLDTAQKDLAFIQQADVKTIHTKIGIGSFVKADDQKYFFLTGLGLLEINGARVFYISVNSPLGKSFSGKQEGSKIIFNEKEFVIQEIF